ncbi:alpha-hydroxy acid oxidase [Halioxenophilus aromaticivorans]|uniref:Alpha-hydroxy acid oxidase n=1 Tax=Halioxenophilus aromaticivorans TaxID=1306992 RepID=A0AAV3TYU1_9ALTE
MDFFYSQKLSRIPADFLSLADYERQAQDFMPHPVYEYIAGGADRDQALNNNRTSFDDWQILPSVLNSFRQANSTVHLIGQALAHPIIAAPVAYQRLVHNEGELATAQACTATESQMVVSTLTSQPLAAIGEQVASPWFQLYFQAQKQQTLQLVRQAEDAGYSALMVTVDVPINGLRIRAQKAGFALPPAVRAVHVSDAPPPLIEANQSVILNGYMAHSPSWDDIAWLQQQTQLPIFLKGILSTHDASQAQQAGLAGVVVSNHGGRSLDCLASPIHQIAAIRAAVGGDFSLILDSGVRHGTDVFKALALGANAVMIGRPIMYGLAIAGALGVAHCLKLLREEFELTMALAGCPTVEAITASHITRRP